MTAYVDISSLAVTIRDRAVLTDVSFRVERGERVGVVGETGAGKSMCLRTLTGTLGRIGGHVSAGRATLGQQDVTRLDERGWRRVRGHQVALVPQGSMQSLDPLMRVGAQVRETVRSLDPGNDVRGRARELLEQVELAEAGRVMALYPHELSGGMRQRVMIALALAGQPEVLLADEPTTALDVRIQRRILELLVRLQASTGMAVVLVTHDLAVVEAITDRVVVLYDGVSVESGPTTEVLVSPRHPYTSALLDARPSLRGTRRRVPDEPRRRLGAAATDPCRYAHRCPFATTTCLSCRPKLLPADGHRTACIRDQDIEMRQLPEAGA